MRSFLLIVTALLAFGATMALEPTNANAVVCADGVVRAACVGPNGAVIVRKPPKHVVHCTYVKVNGVKVRRCT